MVDLEAQKEVAAVRALDLVEPGMVLGLGSGSTVRYFVEGLGRRVAEGLTVRAVPTSEQTARLARSLSINLLDDGVEPIDLAIDGADEIDPDLGLIKGRGGALVREKLVATAAATFIVIADETKLVKRLGRGPLPVEVLPFLWRHTRERLAATGAAIQLRGGESEPFRTDNGNMILDLTFGEPLGDAAGLARELKTTLGVIDHGFFLGTADGAIIADQEEFNSWVASGRRNPPDN